MRPSIAPVSACLSTFILILSMQFSSLAMAESPPAVFPGKHWAERTPAEAGMDAARLDRLAQLLDGRGCVIRGGYVVKSWGSQSKRGDWASSAKPVLSTLLMFAIVEGKIKNADARLEDLGWMLEEKDKRMTVAQLANMISGYARPEAPGAAWAYNDFAIQLYQQTLFDKIFRQEPNQAAAERFAPLELEDGLKWEERRRRLSTSVRDFARLAWFWRQHGQWQGKQLLPRTLFDDCNRPHVPMDLPLSAPGDAPDYLKIGSYGGGSNHFSKAGPGVYGFNWWFNAKGGPHPNALTWPDAPLDTYMSIGAGGNCSVIIPSLDIVLVAAAANWGESDPGNRDAPMNRLIRMLVDSTKPQAAPPLSGEQTGEPKRWHNVALTFTGPATSERAEVNPFRDYRLNVVFAHRMRHVTVPGYYAADGNAAESGADGGNRWRVHFSPDELGAWSYHASFVRGPDVATDLNPGAGTPESFDGASGSFEVEKTDKQAPDLRALGLLRDVRQRYFVFAETDQPFLKGGADSPENFLAFDEFDQTKPTHRYEPHAQDARAGDPTWRGGRGKNIFGALNYLSGKGVNSLYFLTMNVKGDGKDVWPWTDQDERYRFDVSKLDQWEIVFTHMDRLGIAMHVVHQEQENDQLLDKGELGPQRKLYYRELIARFGHHPALVWNMGEENTNTTEQLLAFAKYFDALDVYHHPLMVHTFPKDYEKVYAPLLGQRRISGVSLQVGNMQNCAKITSEWLARSQQAGRPWVAMLDEIGPANTGVKPDADDPEHDDVRKYALWAPLMAGGAGCEWLFGYSFAHDDIHLEDFRSRDRMWDLTRFAIEFFRQHVPVRKTQPMPELVSEGAMCLAEPGRVYAVYLPDGGTTELTLKEGRYKVRWYDPRKGGALEAGNVTEITGPGKQSIGAAPRDGQADWAATIRRIDEVKP